LLIGQLRKALGDNAAKPAYIETLSKKGYRLIAEVTHIPSINIPTSLTNKSDKATLEIHINRWLVMIIGVLITAYLVSFYATT
jgi:DNA-binding winged helix-turn-helix (wHTH) protein